MKKLTLYKNHKNSVGYWTIGYEGNTIYISHSTSLKGKAVSHTETVDGGKQSRSLEEQVRSRVRSRALKQLDKGYVKTLEEARKPPTNAMGLVQPMLATSSKRCKVPKVVYMQNKLDGHRCLVTKVDGKMLAYSRQGKQIHTMDHILETLNVPEGSTLDGELYVHGESLQTIASWAKKKQVNSLKLEYHIYDIINDEPYKQRMSTLNCMTWESRVAWFIPTIMIDTEKVDVGLLLIKARESGYEGLILRDPNSKYECGRRSKSLIKVKLMEDDEFEVIDIVPSANGWGVLVCRISGDKTFGTPAPGTHVQKLEALQHKASYIGRRVTVEYSQLTKDGIPFHPVATRWRTDI